MSNSDVKSVIERIKRKLHIETDAHLAASVGVPYQTLNSWKKRNSIPLDYIVRIAEEKQISLDYIFDLDNFVEDQDFEHLMYTSYYTAICEAYDDLVASPGTTKEQFVSYFLRLRMNLEFQAKKMALQKNISLSSAASLVLDDWYKRGVVGKYTPRPKPFDISLLKLDEHN